MRRVNVDGRKAMHSKIRELGSEMTARGACVHMWGCRGAFYMYDANDPDVPGTFIVYAPDRFEAGGK